MKRHKVDAKGLIKRKQDKAREFGRIQQTFLVIVVAQMKQLTQYPAVFHLSHKGQIKCKQDKARKFGRIQ